MIKIHSGATSRSGIEIYFEGVELTETSDGLPLIKVTTDDGTGILPSTIGCACSRDVLFQGWNDFIRLESIPAAITDIATQADTPDLLSFWRQFPCTGIITVRLQVHVVTAVTGKLALQYYTGSSWRYVDGLSGPVVDLSATGVWKSNTVTAELGVAGDVMFRLVTLDGTESGTARLGMVSVDWCFTASSGTPPGGGGGGGTGGGTPGVDPCTPQYENFNYADFDDFQTNWTVTDTMNIGHWVGINTTTFHGTAGRSIQGTVSGCYPSGSLKARRTLTGLRPGESYRVTCWGLMSSRSWFDTSTRLEVIGGTNDAVGGASNTWSELVATGVADTNGELQIEVRRDASYPICYGFNFYFSDMSIQKLGC